MRPFCEPNSPRILSGALHYFRVHPEYWRNRLEWLAGMGLNTVETYIPWNLHEPQPGRYQFSGMLDLEGFINMAEKVGLQVILRPGPYICSEWEMGGLPAWLLKDPSMKLRCSHPAYLDAVARWFDSLLPRLAPLQQSRGGPVIAFQVENEYGGYGNDSAYLEWLVERMRSGGIQELLFTSDGASETMLRNGSLPELYKTVNFGFGAKKALRVLRSIQPDKMPMVTEFWCGWFNHWGEPRHRQMPGVFTDGGTAGLLRTILREGSHVNLYMFHGGTNFGFMNGANYLLDRYFPATTSYDYAAPLSEEGQPTRKYFLMRRVIEEFTGRAAPELPALMPRKAYPRARISAQASLFDCLRLLSSGVSSPLPLNMEALDQAYGFILYRTCLKGPARKTSLTLRGLHDRAQVFANRRQIGVLSRETRKEKMNLNIPAGEVQLDILVENQGRVNYGPELEDRKGILGGVRVGGQLHHGWGNYPLPMDDLTKIEWKQPSGAPALPAFFRAEFEVDLPADTFLYLPGWEKGLAWVNGFHLGRYWKRGPQHTLYIPGPLLRPGVNELILFEQHHCGQRIIEFLDHPRY